MDETRTLAEYVAHARFEDLPADVLLRTKQLVLDHLGVAFFSTTTPWGQIALRYAHEFSAVPQCTVYGQDWKSSMQHAAMANGLCAHGFEMDDTHEAGYCHPGAPTIPAALAVAEHEGRTGRDFLLAVVMGYEVMGRLGRALGRETKKQHHSTGQLGALGSAAAAAKAMDLSVEETTNALGLAGGLASGVMAHAEDPKGTMLKRLYGGWPAQSGVVAAWMAREGMTGPSTIVEGRFGFLRSITPNFDLSRMTSDLGVDFQVMATSFKPYASGRAFHPLVEAIVSLRDDHGVTPDRILRLDVGATESVAGQHMVYKPESIMSAQYSMPFTAALAFSHDLEDPTAYSEDLLSDPAVLDLARRIEAHVDPEIEAASPRYAGRITAHLTDGTTVALTVWDHKGSLARPFTAAELEARFTRFTAPVMGEEHARRVIDAVSLLDEDNPKCLELLLAQLGPD